MVYVRLKHRLKAFERKLAALKLSQIDIYEYDVSDDKIIYVYLYNAFIYNF